MTPSKTAQQRAQEALDVAERRVKKLEAKRAQTRLDAQDAEKELATARQRRDYAAKHPDLSTNGIIEVGPTEEQAKSFESSHKAPDSGPTEQS